jgi:hypothetical protein
VAIGELGALLLADSRQGRHEPPRSDVQDRDGSHRASALPVLAAGQKHCAPASIDRCSAVMNPAASDTDVLGPVAPDVSRDARATLGAVLGT